MTFLSLWRLTVLDELVKWLESERRDLEENAQYAQPDEIGYYGAIINTLDFIQGAEVYLAWKERNQNA